MRRFALTLLTLTLPSFAVDGVAQSSEAIEAARGGGVIIVCRHGLTDSADENEQTLDYTDPSTQRRLSREGERQSAAMGRAFRELGIDASEVVASPMQRTRRMAELMFETVTTDSVWHTRGDNYAAQRERRRALLSLPVRRGNRVIISHIGTLQSVLPEPNTLEEGDCIVLRPAASSFSVVGRVAWRAWIEAAARTRK
jgi:phosphohistidine phosphatase SixA